MKRRGRLKSRSPSWKRKSGRGPSKWPMTHLRVCSTQRRPW